MFSYTYLSIRVWTVFFSVFEHLQYISVIVKEPKNHLSSHFSFYANFNENLFMTYFFERSFKKLTIPFCFVELYRVLHCWVFFLFFAQLFRYQNFITWSIESLLKKCIDFDMFWRVFCAPEEIRTPEVTPICKFLMRSYIFLPLQCTIYPNIRKITNISTFHWHYILKKHN